MGGAAHWCMERAPNALGRHARLPRQSSSLVSCSVRELGGGDVGEGQVRRGRARVLRGEQLAVGVVDVDLAHLRQGGPGEMAASG